jgi:hypothetical protein
MTFQDWYAHAEPIFRVGVKALHGFMQRRQLPFVYSGETNGLHQFPIAPSMLGHEKMFYRIMGR